jgi:quercetin dioxygenase-like cupin family protein
VTGDDRATLLLVIQGTHRLELPETSITLSRPGDYAIWGPGIDHSWEAVSDTTVVTVRWPSSL